ncbi:MAG: hypothetical protein DDT19_02901 [Syntrophomonadaceae bacterium]|nr:hypothetical protein [Bacillota bacterium]
MYGMSTTGVASVGQSFVGQSLQGPAQVRPPSEIGSEMQKLNSAIERLHTRINVLHTNLDSVLDQSEIPNKEGPPHEVSTSSELAGGIRSCSYGVKKGIDVVDDIINRLRI